MRSLVSLTDVTISFGGAPLFTNLSIGLAKGARIALVGRNGSGKSSLMKALAGRIDPDAGSRFAQPGCRVCYLPQEPEDVEDIAVRDYVAASLGPDDGDHHVDRQIEMLRLDPRERLPALSGGALRRASIARALAPRPDVLLADEPTNHLDLPTIQWLEGVLARFDGALMTISHDRAFLRAVSNRICWLDRGRVHVTARGFAAFEDWAEEILAAEEAEIRRAEIRIAQERRYLLRGVTARRRRNRRRVRHLAQLRAEKAARIAKPGAARLEATESASGGGKLVAEAETVWKAFDAPDGRRIVAPDGRRIVAQGFSTRIVRGDRVGLIGPNGAGKTTLLRILIGEEPPDRGSVRLGVGIQLAYVDQNRASLDPDATLWETLCPGGGDRVTVGGKSRHVVSWLRNFLFDDRQAKSPVSSLSGGEKNRLILARELARPSNLLILDEPTNDLDMETLEVLEDMLVDYPGTVLLVSHDRDFLDRVVGGVIAVDGGGVIQEFAGGYDDYARRKSAFKSESASASAPRARAGVGARPPPVRRPGVKLSYKDQRELDGLPERIALLGEQAGLLERELADPDLYSRDPKRFAEATTRLTELRRQLEAAENRWLELEERRESLSSPAGRQDA